MDMDMMEEYDQEGMMDMDDQQMMDEYDEEEQSINFDENPEYQNMPPLDKMRKIRRAIMKTINDMREAHEVPGIYGDVMANKAATEYANYLLLNPEDPEKVEELCKANHVSGKVIPLMGFAILEEDEDHQGTLNEQLMDAHGLLLELEYELGVLADAKNTHIGIGFAFNKEQVKVVEFVTEKPIMINQLNESEDGGVEARGIVLNKEIGIYAARVVAVSKMNKDIKAVGPMNIQFDKGSGNFIINIPGPLENLFFCQADPKLIQFYIRSK